MTTITANHIALSSSGGSIGMDGATLTVSQSEAVGYLIPRPLVSINGNLSLKRSSTRTV